MRNKGFIYIILSGILWGSSGLFVNVMAPLGLSTIQMTCIRGIVSAIIMMIYALICDKSLFRMKKQDYILTLFSGAAMFFTSSFYFSSIREIGVSTAVVLMYTAPVFVMLYSIIFMREKLNLLKLVSLVFMVIGCGLVSGIVGGFNFNLSGMLFGIGSGIAYSAYNILTKIQMKKKVNPLSASMYCFLFMSIVSLPISRPFSIAEIAFKNPYSILLMSGCGIFTCILPYLFYTLALKELPVSTASSLSVLEPLFATVMSIIFLDEKLHLDSFCGICLIISAVFLLSKSKE